MKKTNNRAQMVKLAGLEDTVTITVGAFESTYTKLRETLGVKHIDVRNLLCISRGNVRRGS